MTEGFETMSIKDGYALLRRMNVSKIRAAALAVKGVKQYVLRSER